MILDLGNNGICIKEKSSDAAFLKTFIQIFKWARVTQLTKRVMVTPINCALDTV